MHNRVVGAVVCEARRSGVRLQGSPLWAAVYPSAGDQPPPNGLLKASISLTQVGQGLVTNLE